MMLSSVNTNYLVICLAVDISFNSLILDLVCDNG